MTPEQAKELLPIITAFAEGRTIQSRHIASCNPLDWENRPDPIWTCDHDYRIAPEPAPPRKVQLGPDDFPPPPGAIRLKDESKRERLWEIVTVVEPTGIGTDYNYLTYQELANDYEVFRPGLGWGPGFKLEE